MQSIGDPQHPTSIRIVSGCDERNSRVTWTGCICGRAEQLQLDGEPSVVRRPVSQEANRLPFSTWGNLHGFHAFERAQHLGRDLRRSIPQHPSNARRRRPIGIQLHSHGVHSVSAHEKRVGHNSPSSKLLDLIGVPALDREHAISIDEDHVRLQAQEYDRNSRHEHSRSAAEPGNRLQRSLQRGRGNRATANPAPKHIQTSRRVRSTSERASR